MIHAGGAGFEVEFVTLEGETVSVATVGADAAPFVELSMKTAFI